MGLPLLLIGLQGGKHTLTSLRLLLMFQRLFQWSRQPCSAVLPGKAALTFPHVQLGKEGRWGAAAGRAHDPNRTE